MPNFIGLNLIDAANLAEEYHFDLSVEGEGKCTYQSQEAGNIIEDNKIKLKFE